MAWCRRLVGSLSLRSRECQTTDHLQPATHSLSSVVLPKPVGAEKRVSLRWSPSFSRSTKRGRGTSSGRTGGSRIWFSRGCQSASPFPPHSPKSSKSPGALARAERVTSFSPRYAQDPTDPMYVVAETGRSTVPAAGTVQSRGSARFRAARATWRLCLAHPPRSPERQ